ncbi:prepilin-type N-terminal cleavage/methylation domain-containing protein [Helicobacter sp. 12S02634-8]|uniref:prepilin-type N-terminal cleavage/methylation domain-containing protein n=1 Tax=Helicobacter sp. 12S02634-8 TaxID=1476199 RepID=UPI000BA4FB6D|nr:prepilin-type N-terminal cleavage/methylation domain-containing protein [Helicobacter sp. 12S02634-8]PAF46900.1 prepilin-type N-terminal cleavage/methylation domain-containing protein [Helicobacter sp. 12S02634-8]
MRNAFSMIELVFVIVIIGIIAAIAIPRLSASRSDAQYIAIKNDLQTIINSVQTKSLTEDIDPATINGDFIMDTAQLSPTRWIPTTNGVRLAKDGTIDTANNCVLVEYSANTLQVSIDPSITSPLCQKLAKSYPKQISISLDNASIKL